MAFPSALVLVAVQNLKLTDRIHRSLANLLRTGAPSFDSAKTGLNHRLWTSGGCGEIRTHEGFPLAGFQDRCLQPLGHTSKNWCSRLGSNQRPLPYQGSALPLSYGSDAAKLLGLLKPCMAGQEGLDPPTFGFGDRCAASCATDPLSGGERGIRTLDAGFSPHTPLAGERLRPLGHLSKN